MALSGASLLAEIESGPLAATLASFVAAGNDQAVAAALNDPAGPSAGPLTLASRPRNEVVALLAPLAFVLATKDAATQGAWDRALDIILRADPIAVSGAAAQPLVDGAVATGLLTTDQVAALQTRTGSRAELLWGAGVTVTVNDVSRALRGT